MGFKQNFSEEHFEISTSMILTSRSQMRVRVIVYKTLDQYLISVKV